MFKLRMYFDLPSAPPLPGTATDRLRERLGLAKRARPGLDVVSASAVDLIEGVAFAAQSAGITDLIAFTADDELIFIDHEGRAGDMAALDAAATEKGVVDRSFEVMHLVAGHRDGSLHALVDVEIRRETVAGAAEIRVDIVARPERLRVRRGEELPAWSRRVRAFARDRVALDELLRRLRRLGARMASAMVDALAVRRVFTEPARVELVLPSPEQVHAFESLPFGEGVVAPRYRPEPRRQGIDRWFVPVFDRYFEDRYQPLLEWTLLDAMYHERALRRPEVHVLFPSGDLFHTGVEVEAVHRRAFARRRKRATRARTTVVTGTVTPSVTTIRSG